MRSVSSVLAFVAAGLVFLSWALPALALTLGWSAFLALAAFSRPDPSAGEHFGVGLAVQGKKPEAIAAYRRALELEPALKIAQAAVQRLEAPAAAVGE